MVTFTFTKHAKKKFQQLDGFEQERIINKLKYLKNHENILTVATRLTDFKWATHRLRIGQYRLILFLEKQTPKNFEFLMIDLGHRKEIYK